MPRPQRKIWLTNNDIEQHLADTLTVDDEIIDIGDPVKPVVFDIARSLRVFVNTFADKADRATRRVFADGIIGRLQANPGISDTD